MSPVDDAGRQSEFRGSGRELPSRGSSAWASWWPAVAQTATLLVVSTLAGLVIRAICLDPGPPVDRPEPGTPRASYCAAVDGHAPWLLIVGPPLGILAGWYLLPLARRRPAWGWLVVLVLTIALLVNTGIADHLEFNYTI